MPPGLISWTRKTKKTMAELLDTLAGREDDGGRGPRDRAAHDDGGVGRDTEGKNE